MYRQFFRILAGDTPEGALWKHLGIVARWSWRLVWCGIHRLALDSVAWCAAHVAVTRIVRRCTRQEEVRSGNNKETKERKGGGELSLYLDQGRLTPVPLLAFQESSRMVLVSERLGNMRPVQKKQ